MVVDASYQEFSDEKLVKMSSDGDSKAEEFLLNKYKNFVRSRARSYFIVSGDSDDLIQEGMIGLYNAIKTYDESKTASFMTYAGVCINNKILSAISADKRQKNVPLNEYVSIYSMVKDDTGEETALGNVLPSDNNQNPETIIIDKERKDMIENNLSVNLSSLEKDVLSYYIEGLSYAEIGKIVGKSEKSIDNAIQRIRLKVKKIYY